MTSTVLAETAGATTVMLVGLTYVTDVPDVVPNFTVVPLVKFVPVIVTTVPAEVGPADGVIAVTVGAEAYVN